MIIFRSCAEYGPRIKASVAGVTQLSPIDFYGQQKVAALNFTGEALRESTVRISWVRIFQPYVTGQDKKRLLPLLIETPTEIDVETTFGFTNVELLKHLETLLNDSNQWKRFKVQLHTENSVTVVGKISPIFISDWLQSDSLETGLKWVFDS